MPRPDGETELLGLDVLDEPVAGQADPSVLDLQLRAVTKERNKVNVEFIYIYDLSMKFTSLYICGGSQRDGSTAQGSYKGAK